MNKDEILTGLYSYLINNLPQAGLAVIIKNDIRVENFFTVYSGMYLNTLLQNDQIKSFSLQNTLLLKGRKRVHIDVVFTDAENCTTYIEFKHFSIAQTRGNGRQLSFYTSNSAEGRKVGIVGDCIKFDQLRSKAEINDTINLVCCAFTTPKPTQSKIDDMISRFDEYPELSGWKLQFPVPFAQQTSTFGLITLQKEASSMR
ncbi:hypothetical protein [Spirosoma jeollabukense]